MSENILFDKKKHTLAYRFFNLSGYVFWSRQSHLLCWSKWTCTTGENIKVSRKTERIHNIQRTSYIVNNKKIRQTQRVVWLQTSVFVREFFF